MKSKNNQLEACTEVIRLMEGRKNESLKIVGVPDEIDRKNKAVDLYVRGIKGEYHLEHTLIESFAGQLADGSRFMGLIFPLQEMLKGKLPAGHFDLIVEAGAITGTLDYKKIQTSLEKWVMERSVPLSVKALASKRYQRCRETPPDVPFEVILACDSQLNDVFYVSRYVSGDLEKKRCERVQSALNEKCPKLKEAKIKNGTSTVLILESNDIALANHFSISAAFTSDLNKRQDVPDEVYLVETDIPNQWTIWILKEGASIFPDINNIGPHYIERKVK